MIKHKITNRSMSLLLALVILISSMPLSNVITGFAAGSNGADIDPEFSENVNIQAYFDKNYNINISFDSAEAKSGYYGKKSIKSYIVMINDLSVREKREIVLYTKEFTASQSAKQTISIKHDDIKSFLNKQHNYNVSVFAVDSEGWRSYPIHTFIVSIPINDIPENYSPDPNGKIKYVMDMETSSGIGDNYTPGTTVNNIDINGSNNAVGTGYNDTYAYKFWFNSGGDYSKTTDIDFSYNRRAYNFVSKAGDETVLPNEVIIWVDFTDVSFEEIDFRIRYNDKQRGVTSSKDQISSTVYSTANCKNDTVIYMTDENSFWIKKAYSSGTITDLTNYRGLIRIPVSCFADSDGNTLSKTVHREYGTNINKRSDDISPLEDVYSFGFSIKAGEENKNKSFYIDDIAFYRDDGLDYVYNSDESSAIKNASELYNSAVQIPIAIANYINKNINEHPTYADKAVINYVTDLMALYGVNDAAIQAADSNAYNLYHTGKALVTRLETATDKIIVEGLEREISKLPEVDDIIAFNTESQTLYKQLYATYCGLNLGQLRYLGKDAEDKLLASYELVYGTKDRVGTALSSRPFITFNNFDSNNYPLGMNGYDLYDDYPNAFEDDKLKYDKQHTTALTHYSNATYATRNVSGPEIIDYYQTGEYSTLNSGGAYNRWYANAVKSYISDNGFNNSNCAVMRFDRDLYMIKRTPGFNPFRETATMAFTYNGNSASEWDNLQGLNIENWTDKTIGDTLEDRLRALSLAFYLDTTDVTGLDITLKIITQNNTYYMNNGKDTSQRYIRTLNSNTGEWNTTYLSNTRQYINGKNADGKYALDNFNGWVYIPLVYFKQDATGNALDRNNDLNNIKEIKISFQHRQEYYDNGDGESFSGKTVSVDAFGFTYDPTYYTENASARNDKNFDEVFGIASTASRDFIIAVNNFDIHSDTAQSDLTKLFEKYYALTDYQKTITMVNRAYMYLRECEETILNPAAPKLNVDGLKSAVDALPQMLFSITLDSVETQLPYPLNTQTGEVNYIAFGASKADIDNVIDYYENSFMLMDSAKKSEFGDLYTEKLQTAYNLSKRITLLEGYLTQCKNGADVYNKALITVDADGAKKKMPSVKTDYTDYIKLYTDSSIFAKNTVKASSAKMVNSAFGIAINAADITIDGVKQKGALSVLLDSITNQTASVKDLIDNKIPLSAKIINDTKDIIAQYESMPDYYRDIAEIYNAIKALKVLFPVVSAEDCGITFNASVLNVTGTITISYVAALEDIDVYIANENNTFLLQAADGSTVQYTVKHNGSAVRAGNKIGTVSNSAADPQDGNKAQAQIIELEFDITDQHMQPKLYTGNLELMYTDPGSGVKLLSIPVVYNDEESYIVSIPADSDIDFGAAATRLGELSVDLNITNDKALTVSLENPEDRKMILEKDGKTVSTLPYKLIGESNAEFKSAVYEMSHQDKKIPLTIKISQSDWAKSFVNQYEDTLTFTVECT